MAKASGPRRASTAQVQKAIDVRHLRPSPPPPAKQTKIQQAVQGKGAPVK
jgi:hypothetical protein